MDRWGQGRNATKTWTVCHFLWFSVFQQYCPALFPRVVMPGKVLASSFVSSSSSSNTRHPCLLPSVLCLAGKHVCLRLTFSLSAMDLRKKKKATYKSFSWEKREIPSAGKCGRGRKGEISLRHPLQSHSPCCFMSHFMDLHLILKPSVSFAPWASCAPNISHSGWLEIIADNWPSHPGDNKTTQGEEGSSRIKELQGKFLSTT